MISGAGILFGTGITLLCSAFDYNEIYSNVNIWHKVSTDESAPGEVVALDMSRGYSVCGEDAIYLIVNIQNTEEEAVIAFPNGGYWSAPEVDTLSMEIQKEFGKLEQDLKNK